MIILRQFITIHSDIVALIIIFLRFINFQKNPMVYISTIPVKLMGDVSKVISNRIAGQFIPRVLRSSTRHRKDISSCDGETIMNIYHKKMTMQSQIYVFSKTRF